MSVLVGFSKVSGCFPGQKSGQENGQIEYRSSRDQKWGSLSEVNALILAFSYLLFLFCFDGVFSFMFRLVLPSFF